MKRRYLDWQWNLLGTSLGLLLVVLGCTTPSTVATRKAERPAAYVALSPEDQALVDQGQLRAGFSEDAVYIAWGKPAQILRGGDAQGETTTWLYQSTTSDNYSYWHYYPVPNPRGGVYLARTIETTYQVRAYVSAELVFRNGKLERWQTLPRPPSGSYFDARP